MSVLYHYFFNQTFLVHIDDRMTNVDILLVSPSLLDRPTFQFYVTFFVGFSSAPGSRLGAPMSSQDAPRAPNELTRHSHGHPMTPQGRPKVVIQ